MLRIPCLSTTRFSPHRDTNRKRPPKRRSLSIGAPAGTRIPDPLIKSPLGDSPKGFGRCSPGISAEMLESVVK